MAQDFGVSTVSNTYPNILGLHPPVSKSMTVLQSAGATAGLDAGTVMGKITKSVPTTGTAGGTNTGGGAMASVTGGQKTEVGTYTITCSDVSTVAYGTATATAFTHNTGNGAMGAITVGAGAKVGTYTLEVMKVVGSAGAFVVRYPDGSYCGQGNVASAFTGGGLTFTLADGGTDYIVGDGFTIAVAEAAGGAGAKWEVETPSGLILADKPVTGSAFTSPHLNFTISDSGANFVVGDSFTVAVAVGSGKLAPWNEDAVNGTEVPYAILSEDISLDDYQDADVTIAVYIHGEFVEDNLTFSSTASADEIAAATETLAERGIYMK